MPEGLDILLKNFDWCPVIALLADIELAAAVIGLSPFRGFCLLGLILIFRISREGYTTSVSGLNVFPKLGLVQ